MTATRLDDLVQRARSGDRAAFGEIVRLLEGEVLSFAYHLQADRGRAEDLAQEAFVEAFRRLEDLRDPAQILAWIRGIVRNLHRALRRQEAREPASIAIDLSDADLPLAVSEPADVDLFSGLGPSEIFELLAAEIESLPEHYRTVLLLRHYEKLSCAAIARRLGIPVGTVTMRLTRGHRQLRESITRHVRRAWRP